MENGTEKMDLNVQDYMWRTQLHQLDRIRYLVGKLSDMKVAQWRATRFRRVLNKLEEATCSLLDFDFDGEDNEFLQEESVTHERTSKLGIMDATCDGDVERSDSSERYEMRLRYEMDRVLGRNETHWIKVTF